MTVGEENNGANIRREVTKCERKKYDIIVNNLYVALKWGG